MTYHRLVLKEIAVPLALSLVLVSQLLIAMQLLSLNEVLFGSGFDPVGLLRIASYFAPHFAIIAIPLAFLFAVMLGIGRLSEDGEVVALSALGRSPFHLYRVPIVMGAVLGVGVGALSFYGEPWGLSGIRRQLNELIKRNVAGDITPGTFYEDIPRFTVYVGDSDPKTGRWEKVLLHDAMGDGVPFLILAERGRVESEGADATLRLELEKGELHRTDGNDYTRGKFDAATVSMGVIDFFRRKNRFIRPAAELPGEQMMIEARHARALGDDETARRIETLFHRRVASVFTCLIFGLIAVPLAAAGRGARGRSFVATVFAFAGYYVLLTLGQGLGDTGRWLPWAGAWLPNLAGLGVALVLGLRLHARPPGVGAMIAFRYIARAFVNAVAAALLGVSAIYLVIDYVDRAKSYDGAGWLASVIELYALKLILVVYQLAPAALALGAAISLSALRRTGEVTALRALGRGPLVFAAPIAAIATVVGLSLFAIEDPLIVPANYRAEEITALRFHRWGDWAVYHQAKKWFRGQDGRRLYQLGRAEGPGFADVHVFELSRDFKLRRRIDAASLQPLGDGVWRFSDVVVRDFPAKGEAREERLAERVETPPDDLQLFRVKTGRPSQLRRWELPGQIELREKLGLPSREWVLTLHERRAYQLTGLPTALIGAALALRPRRRGHLTAAIAEGVLVTVGLYAVSAMSHTLTLAGHLAPLVGGWLPFVIASVVAVGTLRWAR